jgi:zinc transport system substrate-binding protein
MCPHVRWILPVLVVAWGSAGCSNTSPPPSNAGDVGGDHDTTVYVVNYPLAYFAQRIGGQWVDVTYPAPPDVDPAFWMPDAETIVAYQEADLILLNGATYARWASTVSLPDTRTIDTSVSFADRYIEVEDAVTHTHGPGGEHAHGGLAFTTWLDPNLAIEQARAIAAAMTQRWPEHKQQFDTGFAALEQDLMGLDAALKQATANANRKPLVFSHPVYQYLERRYDLNGKSVHWEPDEVPTKSQWDELVELLKSHPAKCMVWEGEPNPATVSRLREIDVESVVVDPCGNVPETGDYLSVMQQNISNLARVLGVASP